MDFITRRTVLLPHSVDLELQRYARARRIKPEEAAGAAIQSYLRGQGELELRFVEAARALQAHQRDQQDQTRASAPEHGRDGAA